MEKDAHESQVWSIQDCYEACKIPTDRVFSNSHDALQSETLPSPVTFPMTERQLVGTPLPEAYQIPLVLSVLIGPKNVSASVLESKTPLDLIYS